MPNNKQRSSLEKIGYLKQLPKDADINNYERIIIKEKDGKEMALYRDTSNKKEIDDTTNFSNSWEVFQALL